MFVANSVDIDEVVVSSAPHTETQGYRKRFSIVVKTLAELRGPRTNICTKI